MIGINVGPLVTIWTSLATTPWRKSDRRARSQSQCGDSPGSGRCARHREVAEIVPL